MTLAKAKASVISTLRTVAYAIGINPLELWKELRVSIALLPQLLLLARWILVTAPNPFSWIRAARFALRTGDTALRSIKGNRALFVASLISLTGAPVSIGLIIHSGWYAEDQTLYRLELCLLYLGSIAIGGWLLLKWHTSATRN